MRLLKPKIMTVVVDVLAMVLLLQLALICGLVHQMPRNNKWVNNIRASPNNSTNVDPPSLL